GIAQCLSLGLPKSGSYLISPGNTLKLLPPNIFWNTGLPLSMHISVPAFRISACIGNRPCLFLHSVHNKASQGEGSTAFLAGTECITCFHTARDIAIEATNQTILAQIPTYSSLVLLAQ